MSGASTSLYLYGFVPHPLSPLAEELLQCRPGLMAIDAGRVACVARGVDAARFDVPATSADEQLAWVSPLAADHHETLKGLHAAGAVVPLKFGTLCEGEENVRTIVRQCHDRVAALLDRFRGCDEWTLTVTADADALAATLRASEPRLRQLAQDQQRLPGGHAYFARKQAEREIARLVDSRLAILEDDVLARIEACDIEAAHTADGLSKLPLLVPRRRFGTLESALAALEAAHSEVNVRCELLGPWPPYSFVTALEVSLPAGA